MESTQRVILKDGTKIALELEKIDTLLNSSDFNEEIETRVTQVCVVQCSKGNKASTQIILQEKQCV